MYDLYEWGIKLPTDILNKINPLPVLKEVFRTDGEQFLKFPPAKVIQGTTFVKTATSSKLTLASKNVITFLHLAA